MAQVEAPGKPAPPLSRGSLARLAAAGLVVGLGLAGLWQAGVLFQSDEATTTGARGEIVSLEEADASIETPNALGLSVGLRQGDLAPDFEFSAFDGRRLRLSDFRGRPVLLNFWATWCIPCKRELPAMEALLRRHEADGLAV
ncbi:MAG TPA: redoxin domain-containing protein, partial [Dehalococcoidia bacterium]